MADIFSGKRIEEMLQKAAHGKEPEATEINHEVPGYTIKLMRAFNWYNYEKDLKTARGYLRSWIKKHQPADVKTFDAVPDFYVRPVFGWLARLDEHGAKLSPKDSIRLTDTITNMLSNSVKASAEPVLDDTPKRPSIQDALAAKQSEFLGELEGEIDNFILNDCRKTDFNLFKYLQGNNSPKIFGTAVKGLLDTRINEIAQVTADEQLAEAYGCFTTAQRGRLENFLLELIEDGQRWADFKKANQKVRVKKAKPAGVQVAKLQYLKEFAELGLTSISAPGIVGAQQLWVYNTKNKKLGCYLATGSTGFSVRGTSLQGYDPESSVQRTLRKPDIVTKQVLEAGKVQLRKILSDLTTTETKLNGRINSETILLRVL
jgi:hypothetical protein